MRQYYASERNVAILVGLHSTQGQTQLHTKFGDNAILSQLSANIAVEVIFLRSSFGVILNWFVLMNRDDT